MIRRGTASDGAFCHALTEKEDWNYSMHEIQSMVTNPRVLFFIAEEEAPIGMVASFLYGDAAWIGLLIVAEEYRGQGVGTALLEEALAHLRSAGVTTVTLEAAPEAVPLYKRLGFVPEFDSLRLKGESHAGDAHVSNLQEDLLGEVSLFDQKYFGVERRAFLKEFLTLSSVRLVEGDNTIRGYLMGRTATTHKLGPCVCEDEVFFEKLLTRALPQMEGTVSVGIPSPNKAGVSLLEQHGFSVRGASLRMVWGKKRRGIPERIFAIGGPEKG